MGRPWKLKPVWDKQKNRWKLWIPPLLSVSGRRERKFYRTEEDAKAAANRLRVRHNRFGASLRHLSSERMVEASQAFKTLDEHTEKTGDAVTLREVVAEYLERKKQQSSLVTLTALFKDYVSSRSHRTPDYLKQFKYCEDKLGSLRSKLVTEITATEISNAIADVPAGNRAAYMRYLRALFNLGIKRGYLKENPILRLDFPHRPRQEIYVLPNRLVRAMFEYAQEHEPKLLVFLTLSFFCGIRPDGELPKMAGSDIDFENNRVVIRTAVSKTKRKRFIPLSANATAWLETCRMPKDRSFGVLWQFTEQTLRTSRERVWKAVSKKPWSRNVARHTFGTCFAALHDEKELMDAMGHESTRITFERYAAGTTKEHAQEFFNIYPENEKP